MLGKLFKYEFKNTAKIMLTIYAVVLAVTAFGSILLASDMVWESTSPLAESLSAIMLLAYVLSLFALFIVTFVYLSIHFYKTMYSDQGYLTHTLPVSPLATFHVKLLTSFVWILGAFVLLFLSLLLLITSVTRGEFWTELREIAFPEMSLFFSQTFGMSLGHLVFFVILAAVLSCLSAPLMIFTCASVGQLFQQYKIVAAIVTGVVLYFVEQIIETILLLVLGFGGSMTLLDSGNLTIDMTPLLCGDLLLSLLFIVAYYITCTVIVRKHINLD